MVIATTEPQFFGVVVSNPFEGFNNRFSTKYFFDLVMMMRILMANNWRNKSVIVLLKVNSIAEKCFCLLL